MLTTVHISVVTNYGTERIYPACAVADKFASIAGTKTISRDVLKTIKALGYEILQVSTFKE